MTSPNKSTKTKPNCYICLPWMDDEQLRRGAELLFSRKNYKSSQWEDVDIIGFDKLPQVKNDDMLYISGHCAEGVESIGNSSGQLMSAQELAKKLDKKGLDKGHKAIKLWACYSGDGIFDQPRSGLAYRFWEAMHSAERGYAQLTVYGYRYNVVDPETKYRTAKMGVLLPGFVDITTTPELWQELPGSAKHWRVGIGPDGTLLPPKPLPRGDQDAEDGYPG